MELMNEPLVDEFSGEFLRTPEGDIEVSLGRLKLDLRYGNLSRDLFRLFILGVISVVREESLHG